jgi:hypothetical protein
MSQVMTVLKEVITSCIYLVSDLECTQGTTRLVPRIVWHISTRSATPMTTTITLVLALFASDRRLCHRGHTHARTLWVCTRAAEAGLSLMSGLPIGKLNPDLILLHLRR